jgi:signal peptidase I
MSLWIWLAAVPAVVAGLAVMAARRRFVVVRVNGSSMAPALMPGDRVLVRRGSGDRIRAGAVVVLHQPPNGCPARPETAPGAPGQAGKEWVIKRVAATPGDAVPASVVTAVGGVAVVPPGMLVVLGDNHRSTDSRLWGFLSADHVLGAVVRRIPPPGGRN